jgi:hypothetical protein
MDWDDYHDRIYREVTHGANTSDYARDIWRRDRERINPPPQEPSIHDMIGMAADDVEDVITPSEIGPVRSHQRGSFDAEMRWRAELGQPEKTSATRSRPQSQDLISRMAAEAPEQFRRNCKVCGSPLDPTAPRQRKMHDECRNRTKMRRYRANLKAKKHELEQMLGLVPIEGEQE